MMMKASLYEKAGENVVCLVCERACRIRPNLYGICGNYQNVGGELSHIGYGILSAIESRPIEIKPFFHYWPNSTALTFSGYGCHPSFYNTRRLRDFKNIWPVVSDEF